MVILSKVEVTSSSATPRWEYDVFLSFRGEDTSRFTHHLYTALKQKVINVFRDDEGLERGKSIFELFKAIEESRFAVIVFSKNYADSKWCLKELAKIIECVEKREMTVLPLFYHVDPSHVRHQTGTFANFFAQEMPLKRKICSMEEEEMWRAALTKVGNLSGWHLQGDRYEPEIILEIVEEILLKLHDKFPREYKIVEEIFQKLCDTFPRVTSLVGIRSQVEHLNSLLCVGSDDIRVIGIWGMGGIGKTTLAKVVYDWFSSQFEGCSFIENVKDFSKESDLITLQQYLLDDILEKEDICIKKVYDGVNLIKDGLGSADILEKEVICIKNVNDGVNLIKDGLGSKKILLVLDDVNHLDQLKYLANERNWFGSGSRIIITTRDKQLLRAHNVDAIHECKELNDDDALELFCLKAFKKKQPEEGYEEISWKIVDYADGLPLALDVLGSLLSCREINHWNDAFKRLKQYPEANIFESLKMSYDGLNNETEQSMFIYIACFLRGRNQGLVTDILKSFDLCLTTGMNVLIERSLITISNDIVQMPGLLQVMAWEILRKQSPAEPGNRKGLKLLKDVFDVLENNEGTNALEIIDQDSSIGEVENCTCSPEAFSKMRKLKFLRISNVLFPQGLEFLSNELRILEWHGYPLKSLPLSFQSNEIRELDMRYSKIERLWKGDMDFPNLRSIDLGFSENLIQTPNLAGTPSLEKLDLDFCRNLVDFHPSIFVHKRLNHLSMSNCSSLESLPPKIEMESLIILNLSDCSKVKRIPKFGKNMKCLRHLFLGGTTIEEIPSSIKHLTSLNCLHFSQCSKLGKLPSNLGKIDCLENLESILGHLCDLEALFLDGCNLFAIPNAIGCLSSLKVLNLDDNNFVTLPASISRLSKLEFLYLGCCKRLQSLPKLPSNIDSLVINECTSLEKIPDFSEMGSWGETIFFLYCLDCPKLVENKDISVAILKWHLQGTYGQKVPFAMNYYGSEISEWFAHQGVGNSVSIKLNPNWCDSTWLGFALCAHFDLNFKFDTSVSLFAYFPNGDQKHICLPMELFLTGFKDDQVVWYVPRYDENVDYKLKDRKAFEHYKHIDWNQCSGNIAFYFEADGYGDKFEMNCGVRLVYKQDVEELMQTTFQASGSNIPQNESKEDSSN